MLNILAYVRGSNKAKTYIMYRLDSILKTTSTDIIVTKRFRRSPPFFVLAPFDFLTTFLTIQLSTTVQA